MAILLDTKKLVWSSIPAAAVVSGVVAMNSILQAGYSEKLSRAVGAPLFVLGWVFFAIALSLFGRTKAEIAAVWLVSAAIVIAAIMMNTYMVSGASIPMVLPIVFVVAWISLGWLAGGDSIIRSGVGVIGALCIIAGMFVMPLQLNKCMVHGPGMPLFVLGWTLVVLAVSAEYSKVKI